MTAADTRIPAKGQPRVCPTCATHRDLYIKPRRGKQDEIIYRGHCTVCTNFVGEVPPSKVDDADKARLEVLLELNNPPTLGLFDAHRATAPTELNERGDGS